MKISYLGITVQTPRKYIFHLAGILSLIAGSLECNAQVIATDACSFLATLAHHANSDFTNIYDQSTFISRDGALGQFGTAKGTLRLVQLRECTFRKSYNKRENDWTYDYYCLIKDENPYDILSIFDKNWEYARKCKPIRNAPCEINYQGNLTEDRAYKTNYIECKSMNSEYYVQKEYAIIDKIWAVRVGLKLSGRSK